MILGVPHFQTNPFGKSVAWQFPKEMLSVPSTEHSEDDDEGRLLESGDRLAIGQGHSAAAG